MNKENKDKSGVEEKKEITHEDIVEHIKNCLTCRTIIWQFILKEKLTLKN